jgi:hypothetical protein
MEQALYCCLMMDSRMQLLIKHRSIDDNWHAYDQLYFSYFKGIEDLAQ